MACSPASIICVAESVALALGKEGNELPCCRLTAIQTNGCEVRPLLGLSSPPWHPGLDKATVMDKDGAPNLLVCPFLLSFTRV